MVPTVFIVGESRLPLIPEYLNLGSVVVVSPDRNTLRRWTGEQEDEGASPEFRGREGSRTIVDLLGRRVEHDGACLPLSDLEYRMLSALLHPPGRAISYTELRRIGWGEGSDMPADIYSIRALVQRLRAKLAVARADIRIEAVRGYGLRGVVGAAEALVVRMAEEA